jgi:exodeoxyribonuclease VII large subunit
MNDMNGAGSLPPPAGDACATEPEALHRFTLQGLIKAAASAVRCAFGQVVLVEAQVLSIRETPFGWKVELTEPHTASLATAVTVKCTVKRKVLRAISDQIGMKLRPDMLLNCVIVLRGKPEFHPRYGFELELLGLDPGITQGMIAIREQTIIAALKRDGIFDNQRQLPAPRDVARIGLVAPPMSAGVGDVLVELNRWQKAGIIEEFTYMPAKFEGGQAAESLCKAFLEARLLARSGRIDVLLVVRGGGDPAGLATATDEWVARALLKVPVPIIVGIGHERDRGLLDELAWHSAGTPSKAVQELWKLIYQPAQEALKAWHAVRIGIGRKVQAELLPALESEHAGLIDGARAVLRAEGAELAGFGHVVEHRRSAAWLQWAALDRDLARIAAAVGLDASTWPDREREGLCALYENAGQDALAQLDRVNRLRSGGETLRAELIDVFRRQGVALTTMIESADAGMQKLLLASALEMNGAYAAIEAAEGIDRLQQRGFAMVLGPEGQIVKTAAQARELARLALIFPDGDVAVAPLKPITDATVH